MESIPINRRKFILLSAVGAGAAFFPACYHSPSNFYYKVLNPSEVKLLDAIADQIIPPDDFAGGKEAGVTSYIDQQLAGFFSDQLEMYKVCLPALNSSCSKAYGKDFIALPFEKQFEFLKDTQEGKYNNDNWGGHKASDFFNTVRRHCLQGYYGSPRHGGNKDYVSYRLIGLDYPFIVGRNKY